MTEPTASDPKAPTQSEHALNEAWGNVRAAEQFFNAGNLEKAYAAAYIAEKWTGLASMLHIREQSVLWQQVTPVPSAQEWVPTMADQPAPDLTPKHVHGPECWHDWVLPEEHPEQWSLTLMPRCRNGCRTPYSATTKEQPCPAMCLVTP